MKAVFARESCGDAAFISWHFSWVLDHLYGISPEEIAIGLFWLGGRILPT